MFNGEGFFGIEAHALTKCSQRQQQKKVSGNCFYGQKHESRKLLVAGKLGSLGKPGGGRKCVNVAAHAHCPKAKVKSNLQRQVPKMCFL